MILLAKAFEEGVKAALKFFQGDMGRKALVKGGEMVMKNMNKATVKEAAKAAKALCK